MKDFAKAAEEREAKLRELRGRRQQQEHTFRVLSEMIADPSSHQDPSRQVNIHVLEQRRERSRQKREDLGFELDHLREAESVLLHEAQADLAEQQFDLTKVASRIAESSKRAAWGAFAAALASAVATVYGAVQRPSPPVCNPAVVQAPPPSPPPSVDVSVTLDGRRLPTKTEKRPRH